MKHKLLVILLLAFVASFAQKKDKIVRETITVYGNDSATVAGLKFGVESRITNPKVVAPADVTPTNQSDSIILYNSNPDAVTLKYGRIGHDDDDTIIVKDFGVADVTFRIKASPTIKKSIKILVIDTNKTNFNNLAHGQLYSDSNHTQFVNVVNPDDLANFDVPKIKESIFVVKTRDLVKNSESVQIGWDVIPEDKSDESFEVIQILAANDDSLKVFFKKPGKHRIILTASKSGKKDTVASYQYQVIGYDYSKLEYVVTDDNFFHREYGYPFTITQSGVNFAIGNKYFKNRDKYFILDSYDERVHEIEADTNFQWKDTAIFVDKRSYHPDVAANFTANAATGVDAVNKYRIRRMADGELWMIDNLRYIPTQADNTNFTNTSLASYAASSKDYYRMVANNSQQEGVFYQVYNYLKDIGVSRQAINNNAIIKAPYTDKDINDIQFLCPAGGRLVDVNDWFRVLRRGLNKTIYFVKNNAQINFSDANGSSNTVGFDNTEIPLNYSSGRSVFGISPDQKQFIPFYQAYTGETDKDMSMTLDYTAAGNGSMVGTRENLTSISAKVRTKFSTVRCIIKTEAY